MIVEDWKNTELRKITEEPIYVIGIPYDGNPVMLPGLTPFEESNQGKEKYCYEYLQSIHAENQNVGVVTA